VRYGLVGTGHWAREVHATALHEDPDTELAGVWGRDPAKAGAVAERFGTTVYEDPDAMFADVDAVAFAVPPDVQAPLAVRAARAGCHLLLEKPLALDVEAARSVTDAVEAGGVASVVFFTSRFVPAVARWIDEVRARGGWWGARSTMLAAVLHTDSPFASSPWRAEHGGLWDIGPHALSMAMGVLGPVSRVTGVRGPRDSVQLALQHADGATSSLLLSLAAPEPAARGEFALFGEPGWEHAPTEHGTSAVDALRHAATALAVAAGGGSRHPCNASFGLEVVTVLDRAQRALSSA
jgi:predicted dehydrogenase